MARLPKHSPYCAVLTGASGGIGEAIARRLAPQCAWLILVGRNRAALHALRDTLPISNVHAVDGDLLEEGTMERIEALARELGGVNLLINNAGVSEFHAFATQSEQRIAGMLQTNLLSPMLLSRRLIPQLAAAPQAQIVNVGSVFGQIGFPGFAAYCASKAGLRGFSQALRRELRDTSIAVRHFAPRATATPINSPAVSDMNRALKTTEDAPEDVAAELADFLQGWGWERTIGRKESFFILLNKLAPALPDKTILGQLPVIRKYLPK